MSVPNWFLQIDDFDSGEGGLVAEQQFDAMADFEVEPDSTGGVRLTLVHSPSMRAYLSGKSQTTSITITARQAISLADALREEATPTGEA
jgi:hypothetical protein